MIHAPLEASPPPVFPIRAIRIGLAAMILLLLASTFLTWRVGNEIRRTMTSQIDVLTDSERVEHYGVILEMTIKAVVAHGDAGAAAQYRSVQPKLRATLADLRGDILGPAEREALARVDTSDLSLIAMEYQALDLVAKGKVAEARAIVNSRRYDYLVNIYVEGIRAIQQRAARFIAITRDELNFYLWIIVVMSAMSLVLIILGWFTLIRPTRQWGEQLDKARATAEQIAGELKAKQGELKRLNRLLFDQARTDALTGLHTRLKFNEDIEQIWPRIERHGERFCALMCDVDFFKQYNDSCGHLAGDTALRRVAEAMQSVCRAGDHLYRFGGEEFLIILHNCDAEGALKSAAHYRAAVEELAIAHPASALGIVTVSIGAACLQRGDGHSTQSWLGEADAALYQAKAEGRNCVRTLDRVAA